MEITNHPIIFIRVSYHLIYINTTEVYVNNKTHFNTIKMGRPTLIFLILCIIVETGYAGIVILPKYKIMIYNKIRNSSVGVHCRSSDDDLGYHKLRPFQSINWSFRQNIWFTTRFSCQFSWGRKRRDVNVFDSKLSKSCHSRSGNLCFWSIRPDGFYLSNTIYMKDHYRVYTWGKDDTNGSLAIAEERLGKQEREEVTEELDADDDSGGYVEDEGVSPTAAAPRIGRP